ncbi:class I SAM-dependent methyltransferase [Bradyrhizobium lablabi]|uniref:class I SAM-dependent methyltransferase n=1 Tax=Bradyrhizobium lablabi TaxID=722472 RepID=UPI001BAC5DFC|nr:class I SAM-dependent methyltransferase [Bradyrhizobium lablabi]MBR0697374.1 class I SAM-dependent methyltransferase [Bradyrhizobium lablabi]
MVDQDSIPTRKWASGVTGSPGIAHSVLARDDETPANVADIYNQAGDDYASYADGDPSQLFAFGGMHAYADRHVWAVLETKLADLRASGKRSVRFLDAGCGPGTWLRRLILRARALGFSSITARGFDIAEAQIQRARLTAAASLSEVNVTFDVADLADRLPEPDASVDITLCLYSALSHLPVERLTDISGEIARVTSGHFITTVRSIGSTPTAFVESLENVRRLKHDHTNDRCEIDLSDGRHMAFGFHLFTADELRNHFARNFDIEDLRGLDLFHGRFMPDARWNPSQAAESQIADELDRLERAYATNTEFMDRATHLLLIARSRQVATSIENLDSNSAALDLAIDRTCPT